MVDYKKLIADEIERVNKEFQKQLDNNKHLPADLVKKLRNKKLNPFADFYRGRAVGSLSKITLDEWVWNIYTKISKEKNARN